MNWFDSWLDYLPRFSTVYTYRFQVELGSPIFLEVAVPRQVLDADFNAIRFIIFVLVTVVFEIDGPFGVVSAEQVHILILVAGGNEFFEAQFLEVERKVTEEIAHMRIITVAIHHLALEVVLIMLQLPLNVRQLCVKLILLRVFGLI